MSLSTIFQLYLGSQVLLVEQTGIHRENYRPAVSHRENYRPAASHRENYRPAASHWENYRPSVSHRENYRPAASHWETLSHNEYTSPERDSNSQH